MKRIAPLLLLAALTACAPKAAENGPDLFPAEPFSGEVDGTPVALYTLRNGGTTLQVTNFGARVVSLFTRDRDGKYEDIVVGHRSLEEYVTPPGERFLGATVGPVANRIGGAAFEIDGVRYETPKNDNGANTLHGGFKGTDMVPWDVVEACDTALVLHILCPNGFEGFPGNLSMTLTYSLEPTGDFTVDFFADTDMPTPVNFTHHPFFCLRGEGNGSVEEYELRINASHFIPIDGLSIPTGEIRPVEGTPFDFREPHRIGERIADDDEQLRNGHGYDHNWCLDRETLHGLEFACRLSDPVSGRWVEVWTTEPGLQVYSGNFFRGGEYGANGNELGFRSSVALEAQQYPDAVNQPDFGNILIGPGEVYTQTTVYRFGAE